MAQLRFTIAWENVIFHTIEHLLAIRGLFYIVSLQPQWQTFAWTCLLCLLSNLGITAGAHRLWCHRSFKATLPLRIFLCLCQTLAYQRSAITWARDHRVHHKYVDSDADPYNATRGFFFSHMGWLLIRKHPDVTAKGKTMDMSDLMADPVLRFQAKHYFVLLLLFWFLLPVMVPVMFWNEDYYVSLCVAVAARHVYSLHCIWLVNSAAHMWGMRPYDANITPTENWFASLLSSGEGWHNYHHTFPWDYKAQELGLGYGSVTTRFIDLMAKIGWAYDLKSASEDTVKQRIIRTGSKSMDSTLKVDNCDPYDE